MRLHAKDDPEKVSRILDELKHSLEELSRSDTNKIVLTIASAIGNTIGEQAEDITGFCAIVLYFIINGSEASYCADIVQSI